MCLVTTTDLSKLVHFSRSQTVMYKIEVVISWKRWKIETLLLQTTDPKCYRIAAFPMTLSDLQGHSLLQTFSYAGLRTAVKQLTRFQLTARRASRGPSAIAELLVINPDDRHMQLVSCCLPPSLKTALLSFLAQTLPGTHIIRSYYLPIITLPLSWGRNGA